MKPFSRSEIKVTVLILVGLMVVSSYNFALSLRRARDSERKSDINAIVGAIEKYHTDFALYPPSSEGGKIKACRPENINILNAQLGEKEIDIVTYLQNLQPCEWGVDSLRDINDDNYKAYIDRLPSDPLSSKGFSYRYISTGNNFQIFSYLEGEEKETGYRDEIVARNLKCGINICNFGKSVMDVPLDKSLEEYENELRERLRK